MSLRSLYAPFENTPPGSEENTLTIELVFAQNRSKVELTDSLRERLEDVEFIVDSAFENEDPGRFFFVRFPRANAQGLEHEVFALAREMRAHTEALNANPVLPDTFFGGASLMPGLDTESVTSLCTTPKSFDLARGWVHPLMDTISAWQSTQGQGATVAVIDTGYSDHQEVSGILTTSGHANLVEGGSNAHDRFSNVFLGNPGHGTLVMSVIAGRGGATPAGDTVPDGITGSAPLANILPIRAIRSVVNLTQKRIPGAIRHAVAQGADVIVMAMGGASRVASVEHALREAVAMGIVVVCASGNCFKMVIFPAAYSQFGLCCAIAALDNNLRPWKKTGQGRAITVSAPGENVWGAAKSSADAPNNGIKPAQGTTLATSLTGGVAALWVAHHGGRAALKQIADAAGTTVQSMFMRAITHDLVPPPVWNGSDDYGAGVVNAAKALSYPLPQPVEAPITAPVAQPTVLTSEILKAHLAAYKPEALEELDDSIAPLSGEILWQSYQASARARAVEDSALEAVIPVPTLSPAVSQATSTKAALRAFAQGR